MKQFMSYISNNRKVIIPIAATIMLVALMIVIAVSLFSKSVQKTSEQSEQTMSKDWLKPAETLEVGEYRYVSPCQVLPLADVKNVFGKTFNGDTRIREKYTDKQLTEEQVGAKYQTLGCSYEFDGEDGAMLSLEAYPFYNEKDITDFATTVLNTNDQDDEVLSKLKSATNNGSSSSKDFISRIDKTIEEFSDRNEKISKDTTERPIEEIVPTTISSFNGNVGIGSSMYDEGTFEFLYKYDNAYYGLKYTPAKSEAEESFDKYSDEYITDVIEKYGKLVGVMDTKLADKNLSQSPAPTAPQANDKYGSSRLLESCSIADAATYTAAFGGIDTTSVERFGYTYDATKPVESDKASKKIRYGACTRVTFDAVASSRKSLSFSLNVGPDEKTTAEWQKERSMDDDEITRTDLQTDADSAYYIALKTDPSYKSYSFKVGPYVGSFTASNYIGQTNHPVVDVTIVNTINLMVKNLKRDLSSVR